MICPVCHHENPEGARFCMNCGNSLISSPSSVTPKIAIPSAPVDYTNKLEKARSSHAMEGERRVVTILFCDVSGSTALAEGMDPEEWAGIMNRAFEYLIAPVYRYEGTVARLMGDAILAFFGAPIAHEDDPQRAVLAGLEIQASVENFSGQLQRQYGIDFHLRVGINTGLVVVGQVGSDLRMEYTAMGDAVNLAARMEQTAQPGTVLVAEETYRSVASLFEFEPLGAISVKGKREPVQAYRVLRRIEGAYSTRGIQGLSSPLVGRAAELGQLRESTGHLLDGRGQIVSVVGEGGLGKSRLVAELRRSLAAENLLQAGDQPAPVAWHEGRSLSYETSTPYAPFTHILSSLLGLPFSRSSPDNGYAALKNRVAELSEHPEQLAPPLAMLLGVTIPGEDDDRVRYLTPPQLRERIFQAVLEVVECLASRQKRVLVFEDLHWADTASLDLLDQLIGLTAQAPVMILAVFRPNRQDPSWRFHEAALQRFPDRYTAITLQPLNEKQSRELVANLLTIEDLPERVRALILQKAEGNPFYVEEVIRSLMDNRLIVREEDHWRATRAIEQIAIPDTLAGVITARLDRLNTETRHVAQEAAVIGREFSANLLEAIHAGAGGSGPVWAALNMLEQRELIHPKAGQTEPVYVFKHILTQETAYQSLLVSKRQELHLRAGQALERGHPGQVEMIAWHFYEAREPRALPFLLEAGNRAARTYSTPEAILYYRRALEFVPEAEDNLLARRVYEGLGRALTFANRVPEAVETYQAMYAEGGRRGDIPTQVSALNKLSDIVAMRMGQFPEAEKLLLDAEQLARQYNDKAGLAELFMVRCGLCTAKGDFAHAVSYLDESVSLARDLDQKADVALGLSHIANTQTYMAQFDQAWETAQQSLKISREIGNRELQSEVLGLSLPIYYIHNADYDAAYGSAREGALIAAEIGAAMSESFAAFSCSRICLERGDYEQAMRWAEESARAGEAFGMPFLIAMGLCTLGSLYLQISSGLSAQATEAHTRTLELLDMPGGSMSGGVTLSDLGFCALALGEPERAAEYFQKGLTTPNPLILINRPRFLVGLALVAQAQGDLDAAQASLDQAREDAGAKGMRQFSPLIDLVQGNLYQARREYPSALACYDRAIEEARGMDLRPLLWHAQLGAAQTLEAMAQPEQAEERKREADEMIQEMSALFTDRSLAESFINTHETHMPLI